MLYTLSNVTNEEAVIIAYENNLTKIFPNVDNTATRRISEEMEVIVPKAWNTKGPLPDTFMRNWPHFSSDGILYMCLNTSMSNCNRYDISNISRKPVGATTSLVGFHTDSINFNALVIDDSTIFGAHEVNSFMEDEDKDYPFQWSNLQFQREPSFSLTYDELLKIREQNPALQYLHGFKHYAELRSQKYIYFLFNIKQNSRTLWESRISRICSEDRKFLSYTELGFISITSPEQNYGRMQLAINGKIGRELAHHLSPEQNNFSNDVLLVSFENQVVAEDKFKLSPSGSTLALVSVERVNQALERRIADCYLGHGMRGPHAFVPSTGNHCQMPRSIVEENSCLSYSTVNSPIGSGESDDQRIQLQELLTLPTINITGMDIGPTQDGNSTFLLVSTSEGSVIQYHVRVRNKKLEIVELDKKHLSDRPLFSLVSDFDANYFYTHDSHRVFREPLHNCEKAQTCDVCLSRVSPHCGWCVALGSCTSKERCIYRGRSQSPTTMERVRRREQLATVSDEDKLWLSSGNNINHS
ncbi:Plexin-A2 [Cichlidogyrus casuarinus]|uniref:Plexin-A2 n=1 Tax=Cichlidogyrus casuarinus TaxID=1844966 RepID=A0ABD2QKH7_9PLAT